MLLVDLLLERVHLRRLHFLQLLFHLGRVVAVLFQIKDFGELAAVGGGMLEEYLVDNLVEVFLRVRGLVIGDRVAGEVPDGASDAQGGQRV